MSAKTKIVVVRMKNLIFTGVLIGIAILMLFMIINVLVSGRKSATPAMAPSLYVPGVYSSSVLLNGSSLDVQVTVDDNYITSVELVNLDICFFQCIFDCCHEHHGGVLVSLGICNIVHRLVLKNLN